MRIKFKALTISLLITAATLITSNVKADDPLPPPPPGHGETGNVPGGGAPIGGGLFILLGLGTAYGGFRGYKFYKKKKKSLLE